MIHASVVAMTYVNAALAVDELGPPFRASLERASAFSLRPSGSEKRRDVTPLRSVGFEEINPWS